MKNIIYSLFCFVLIGIFGCAPEGQATADDEVVTDDSVFPSVKNKNEEIRPCFEITGADYNSDFQGSLNELANLKFIQTNAGLFMLLDLSEYCPSFEKEQSYFELLLNKYKINMTPGSDLGLPKPGFFRICFGRKKEEILEYIIRMKEFSANELN